MSWNIGVIYYLTGGGGGIGAPWMEVKEDKTISYIHFPPSIGNGGFSLRNVKKFIELYNIQISIIRLMLLFTIYYDNLVFISKQNKFYFIFRIPLRFILKILKYFFLKKGNDDNEDIVWSKLLYEKGCLPDTGKATRFSFEYYPEYLYKLNKELLPFGCHAWYKDCNYIFWKKFITI
jgi:hypothetical protein